MTDKCQLVSSNVAAGFPSPADDYLEGELDLNSYLVKNPVASFFIRVAGDSMINAGIFDKDLLVVDRSRITKNGDIVIAVVDGEFTVKRYNISDGKVTLIAENPNYPSIELTEEILQIWGVVTSTIHEFH